MNEKMFTPQHGDRIGSPNIAIIIVAGGSDKNRHLTVPEATRAKDRGTFIIAVGIGKKVLEIT